MPNATLIVSQPGVDTRTSEISDAVVSIGRAADNTISLEGDSNVSRYHAEIETRGEEIWIIDLGSSNDTTVNDLPVEFERALVDGDIISIGGSTRIEFLHHLASLETQSVSSVSDVGIPGGAALSMPQ